MCSVSSAVATPSEIAPVNLAPRAQAPQLPRQLSDAEFAMLRGAGPARRAAAGEVLFRKGELGHNMYVIESGQVRLDFGDGLPGKLLGAREYFGELALFIGNHARIAGAVTHTAANLRVVDHPAFDHLLENEPSLLAQFMRRSFAYLVASEQRLIETLKRRNDDLLASLDALRQLHIQPANAHRLLHTDELTGLINRHGLYRQLERLAELRVAGTRMALLLVDLDGFKRINVEFGHRAGDQLLCAVAGEVARAAAPCDLACRVGGDEFALLAQLDAAHQVERLAQHVMSGIRSLQFAEPLEALTPSISIGACWCAEDCDWSVWYRQADAALRHSKGQGGNAWTIESC